MTVQPPADSTYDADTLRTLYAEQIIQTTKQTFNDEIAEQELTSPELLGWQVTGVTMIDDTVTASTSIFNTNPILHLKFDLTFDGTKAFYPLTIDDEYGSTWYSNMILYLQTFFYDFAIKYNPFVILSVGIVKLSEIIAKGVEDTVNWLQTNWIKLLLALGGIGIIIVVIIHYMNGGD
ncbi:MAG: hypothetical protein QXE51_02715 [Nitrososphaeria archaeon]